MKNLNYTKLMREFASFFTQEIKRGIHTNKKRNSNSNKNSELYIIYVNFIKALYKNKLNLRSSDFKTYDEVIAFLLNFNPNVTISRNHLSQLKTRGSGFKKVPLSWESTTFAGYVKEKFPDFSIEGFIFESNYPKIYVKNGVTRIKYPSLWFDKGTISKPQWTKGDGVFFTDFSISDLVETKERSVKIKNLFFISMLTYICIMLPYCMLILVSLDMSEVSQDIHDSFEPTEEVDLEYISVIVESINRHKDLPAFEFDFCDDFSNHISSYFKKKPTIDPELLQKNMSKNLGAYLANHQIWILEDPENGKSTSEICTEIVNQMERGQTINVYSPTTTEYSTSTICSDTSAKNLDTYQPMHEDKNYSPVKEQIENLIEHTDKAKRVIVVQPAGEVPQALPSWHEIAKEPNKIDNPEEWEKWYKNVQIQKSWVSRYPFLNEEYVKITFKSESTESKAAEPEVAEPEKADNTKWMEDTDSFNLSDLFKD